jgi:hypothetical protein
MLAQKQERKPRILAIINRPSKKLFVYFFKKNYFMKIILKHFLINSVLFFATLLFSCFFVVIVLKSSEQMLGANLKYNYECDPRPEMWVPDPLLGYRNKPNYEHIVFGNIVVHINEQGFRCNGPVVVNKKQGITRIVGVGDSMMWGTRVNAEDSFCGMLEKLLRRSGETNIEVINCGVVGYSVFQQYLLFERDILKYDPDIVLLSMMDFDHAANEDPFNNGRDATIHYIENIIKYSREQFNDDEIEIVNKLIDEIEKSAFVRDVLNPSIRTKEQRDVIDKIFLEIPCLKMQSLAEKHSFRFIVLFLHPDIYLHDYMRNNGIEFIEFPKLSENRQQRFAAEYDWPTTPPFLQNIFDARILRSLHLGRSIDNLRRLFHFRWQHSHNVFIDSSGHPSKKGNRIIAENIMARLRINPSRDLRAEIP